MRMKMKVSTITKTIIRRMWRMREDRVGELVEQLKDRDWRVRCSAAGALKEITGEDFGTRYRKWRRWWRKQRK